MKLIRQPNSWSCAVCSYAMLLDMSLDEIIREIGHDGSEIIEKSLPEPFKRRGFHPQELNDVAYAHGYSVMEIQVLPCSVTVPGGPIFDIPINDAPGRFEGYLLGNTGVITGITRGAHHAVAWDGERIFDPRGRVVTLDNPGMGIKNFYIFNRRIERASFD